MKYLKTTACLCGAMLCIATVSNFNMCTAQVKKSAIKMTTTSKVKANQKKSALQKGEENFKYSVDEFADDLHGWMDASWMK